jgi:LPXTG-motif cell wall-anchored protein
MRIRRIFAGATVGMLATLMLAAPAQANTAKPVATFTDSCTSGKVSISVSTTGNEPVQFKIPGVAGASSWVSITKATSPKTFEDASGNQLTLRWKNAAGQDLEAQAPHKWSFNAAKCGVQFASTAPTCDNPHLTVTVANPNIDGVQDVMVGFKMDELRTLRKGGTTSFTSTGDITVYYEQWWNGDQYGHKTFDFVAPTGCATPVVEQQNAVIVVGGGDGGAAGKGGTAAGGGESLPVTGSPVRAAVIVGLVLLAVGVVGLLVARRRRVRFTSAG